MSATELKDPANIDDELWNVHERTRQNGHVLAEVTDYTRAGRTDGTAHRIVVRYELPNGETGAERFATPRVDSPEFALVRLLDAYGYSIAQIEALPGTLIELAYTDGEYEIVVPEHTPPRRERLAAGWSDAVEHTMSSPAIRWCAAVIGTLVIIGCWPLSGIVAVRYARENTGTGVMSDRFAVALLGTAAFIAFHLMLGVLDASTLELFWHWGPSTPGNVNLEWGGAP